MKNYYLLLSVLVILNFAQFGNAKTYLIIDTFVRSGAQVQFAVPAHSTEYDYWWTPYDYQTVDEERIQPVFGTQYKFHDVDSALGGQRDLICGFEANATEGTSAVVGVVNQAGDVGFSQGYIGGAYFQWDGDDSNDNATVPDPGVHLTDTAGVGQAVNTTSYPERNADGKSVDFTYGNRALGIVIDTVADHVVYYYLDVIDNTGSHIFLRFDAEETQDPVRRWVRFNDPGWLFQGGDPITPSDPFFWNRVVAFQVRIWTFTDNAGESVAIDTAFRFLRTFGLVIPGTVQNDCDCNGTGESAVQGAGMNLYLGSTSSGLLVATTTTDSTGFFQFSVYDNDQPILAGTTYTVCVADLTRGRCPSDNGCRTTTTSSLPIGLIDPDPINLRFFYTQQASLSPPPPQTIQCGQCSTNICLGNATATTCTGGSTSVPTHTDSRSLTCPDRITRTFSFNGLTATQIITVDDIVAPTINPQASSDSISCPTSGAMSSWVSTRGGAVATDCNSFVWSNNWNGQEPTCGTSSPVTFTATDACGNPSRTTATFSINDTQPPAISTQPTSSSAECNTNNSDFTALTAWLNNNAGARATDNCGAVTFTNSYQTGSLTRGCSTSTVVIFTARDGCGNLTPVTSTFSIIDNTPPQITRQASNQSGDCNSSQTGSSYTTWLASNGGATASDTCSGTVNWSNNAGTGGAPGGCSDGRTVTFTATDNCSQSVQTTATFTVADNSPPTISPQASNLAINCGDLNAPQLLQAWLNNNGGADATDNCSGVTWTNNYNSQNTGSCSGIPVTFTACDGCAASANDPLHCRQTTATYSTTDTEAPTFNPQPQNSGAECGPAAQSAFTAWLNSNAGAIAGDTCSANSQIVVTNNWPVGTLPALGCNNPTSVTFTARDPCNQIGRATAVFTISDSTPPNFTNLPRDSTIDCSSTSNTQYNSWINSRAGATAIDTCTSVTITPLNAPSTPNFSQCSGTTTVTFIARDNCNLQTPATASFTIIDNDAPVINTQAQDRNIVCSGGSTQSQLDSWIASHGGATATDACSGVTWTNTSPVLTGTCTASTTVIFTVSDACGQQSSTTATFSQTDNQGPQITTPAQSLTVPCDSNTLNRFSQWINSNAGAVAVDACQTTAIQWNALLGDGVIGCDFETVTFVASDSCGQSSRTTATFTSQDTSPPTFSPPAQDLTVECSPGGSQNDYNNWVSNHGGAVAVDACSLGFTWTSTAPANGPSGCGSQIVTFTATDNCNNFGRTTATFTIRDSNNPNWVQLPTDRVVECNGTGNQNDLSSWVQSNGGGIATDNCATTVTYTQTAGVQAGNSCRTVRPYTFRAADNCGNQNFATANFVVVDSTPPIVTNPSDVTYECDGNDNSAQINGWVASHGGATATDACNNAITWANNFPAQGPLPCTSLLVNFIATDACGFSTIVSATVTIDDTLDPTFTDFPDDFILPCDADISVDALGKPSAFDQCDGLLFVSLDESTFDEPPIGNCPGDHVVTRVWSAIDSCGNGITDTQTIRVEIVRSSGPCDPTGCECNDCCPPAAASNCLSAPCNPTPCQPVPCTATACTCATGSFAREVRDVPMDLIEPLPQCKPVYIYVNDDDDSIDEKADTVVAQQRMLVTNEPLHESAFRPKSSASTIGFSLFLIILVLAIFF